MYPFLFVLPDGNVFYAGSENAENEQQAHGRLLEMDYEAMGGPAGTWSDQVFTSTIAGGSAVQYAPGKILKAGGPQFPLATNPTRVQVTTTEHIDLSSGDYESISGFDEVGSLHHARHYGYLVVLPDGKVAQVGGNERGNGEAGQSPLNPCTVNSESLYDIDCLDGGQPNCPSVCREDDTCSLVTATPCTQDSHCPSTSTCSAAGRCTSLSCNDDMDCQPVNTCGPGQSGQCYPANNECDASKHAEIWDPECMTWTELDEETDPRLYHGGAILLHDGGVLSASGGHVRQGLQDHFTGEVLRPAYGPSQGPAPEFALPQGDEVNWLSEPLPPSLPIGGTLDVSLAQTDPMPARATLVRLGAATHGFDMDQRFLELDFTPSAEEEEAITLHGPPSHNHAPPGYYMLFLMDEDGNLFDPVENTGGRYVRIVAGETGDAEEMEVKWVCPTSGDFDAYRVSCDGEPVSGTCRPSDEVVTPLSAPDVEGPSGTVEGFHIVVPDRWVVDPVHPSARQEQILLNMCVSACEQHFAAQPGVTAVCDAVDAFDSPEMLEPGGHRSLDWVLPSRQDASGIFGTETLSCSLGIDCHLAFDEDLASTVPRRSTPASSMAGVGEEWRVTVSGELEADSMDATSPETADLSGSVGFSECTEGNDNAPCPFYLGSLELELDEPLELELSCGGSLFTHELEELTISLAQPAFGIAKEGTGLRGFPPGAVVLETQGVVDGVTFETRRANHNPVKMVASNGWVSMLGPNYGARIDLEIPCGAGVTVVTLTWDFHAVAWPDKPPSIEIDVPSTVSCPDTVPLDYTATDSDNDIDTVTWLVDGVLLEDSLTSLDFSQGHELTAIVRDDRGATHTAVKQVSCL